MTCVVIALNEYARDIISASLKSLGSEVVLLNSLGELSATLQQTPTSGILVELATAIRATPQEKASTKDLIELYPYDKFKVTGNVVQMLGRISVGKFVDECLHFTPRRIRKEPRQVKYLAVQISADGTFQDAEKAVTANVSTSGCFVYSAREWNIGDRVWLRFLDNEADFQGTVRSWLPWGNNKYIPGIGIELDPNEDGTGISK